MRMGLFRDLIYLLSREQFFCLRKELGKSIWGLHLDSFFRENPMRRGGLAVSAFRRADRCPKTHHMSGKSVTILDLDFNPCSYESNWEEILFLCSAIFDEIVCDEKWVNYALKKLKVIVLSEGKKLCMIILHIQWYFLHIRGQQSRKIDCIAPRIYISLCAEYNLKSFIHSSWRVGQVHVIASPHEKHRPIPLPFFIRENIIWDMTPSCFAQRIFLLRRYRISGSVAELTSSSRKISSLFFRKCSLGHA